MSTHTPNSRRRPATPRQVARAMRRGFVPANPRPRPPMPYSSTPDRSQTALSLERVDAREEEREELVEAPVEEPARRWGSALFLAQGLDYSERDRDGAGWMAGLRGRLPRRSPYSWRERDWHSGVWAERLRAVPVIAGILVALLVVGAFAFVVASHTATGAASRLHTTSSHNTSASQPSSGGMLLQQPPAGVPTPVAPTYTIGTWVTDYAPASGGTEQVYVRVSKNANPVGGVPVVLSISWGSGGTSYGPVATNSYGLASFHVAVSGPPGHPEFVTASASVDKSTITANTTFVPGGGAARISGGNGNTPSYQLPSFVP